VTWHEIAASQVIQPSELRGGVPCGDALPGLCTDPTSGAFGRMVQEGVGEVNRQLLASQADLQQLALGNAQNLHQIMIRLEESRLSFQLLLQVRNRLLEAYQDVMKMQV
jgi:flagellar hook-basal body complex protein FliE